MQRTLSGRANGRHDARHEGAPAAEAAWIAGSGELGRRLSMAISERMSERGEPLALYEQMSGLGSARRLPGLATLTLTLIPTLPSPSP